MISLERVFSNYFNEKEITSIRLANFADDVLNRLIATNADGNNTVLINKLTPVLANLKTELGETDTARGIQKGKTLTVDQFMEDFKEFIRFYEGAITVALGGTKTPAYMEFFPAGPAEYTKTNKTQMPMLLNRLKAAASKYGGKLDVIIAGKLLEFESTWQSIRNEQKQQKASLSDNRAGRQDARAETEIVLSKIIYAIADRYTHNVDECLKYFDENLLYGQSRKKRKEENKKTKEAA